MNTENLIFTRYLYIKTEVEHSLLYSILFQNIEQSLFWGFELFYSSNNYFELLEYLSKIYETYYKNYTNLGKFLNKKCIEFSELDNTQNIQQEQACIIAIIIRNLTAKKIIFNGQDRKVFIIMDYKDILKYKTIESVKLIKTNPNPRFILKTVCKYTPFRETIQLDNFDPIENKQYLNIQEKYYYHWLYYASFSTIWLNRIYIYKGIINHNKQIIEFENDDMFEEFYEFYNYEPDEQSYEIRLRNVPI